MRRNQFIETVRTRADLDTEDDVETVTVATFQALGVRIAEGEAEDLADRLPDELAGTLSAEPGQATELPAEEFVERVENEESEAGIEGDTQAHVRAVLGTLSKAVDDGWRGVATQLPESYDRLIA